MSGTRSSRFAPSSALLGLAVLACGLLASGDRKEPAADSKATAARPGDQAPRELTAEERQAVLARVGERTITLGEYVATLERMDPFERLRYQSAERRKQL